MSMLKAITIAAVAATGALTIAAPAQAVITTFASYSPIGNASNIYFKNSAANGSGGTTGSLYTVAANTKVPGSVDVKFSFLQPGIAPYVTDVVAKFTFLANGGIATAAGNNILDEDITGTFSFLTTTSLTVGTHVFAAGSNLLSASFANADILGKRAGATASVGGSVGSGTAITYTSDFLDFSQTVDRDFLLSLTSISSALSAIPSTPNSTPLTALRTFKGVSTGSFSSNPAPIVTAVPEPAVWGLMIVGFGMVGFQSRRRVRSGVVAA